MPWSNYLGLSRLIILTYFARPNIQMRHTDPTLMLQSRGIISVAKETIFLLVSTTEFAKHNNSLLWAEMPSYR